MSNNKLKNAALLASAAFFICTTSIAQFRRVDTIPVTENSNPLKMPWVGGHNFCQFSEIDVNFDGIKDLFVFDRAGHKVSVYINKGTLNTVDYVDSTQKYAPMFPHMEDWALLRDYNCDGLPDIFTYAITLGGVKVWKNTSSGGNLQFTLATPYILSNYNPSISNLYVSRVDLPSIDDVDGDGDLDVLTFDFSNTTLEYQINRSKEMGYGCDSLNFQLDPNGCWGNFTEDLSGCGVNLNQSCRVGRPEGGQMANDPERIRAYEQLARERHAGNCVMCIDMDDDDDKEALLGQLSCCNMVLLTNGGTPASANMVSKDTTFPMNNLPVSILAFPCGEFLDVNNDGRRDLLISPNAPGVSIDNQSIWYYENTGTDSTPVFSRIKRNFLQGDMIEVGTAADPVFFDFDNDGLTDLLISNYATNDDTSCSLATYTYNVKAYKNTGSASSPKFDLVNTDYANLSVQLPTLAGKHLTFGDIDGDGKKDMMVGDNNGTIHFFKNTAVSGPAIFTLTTQNYPDNTSTPIDIGNYATPQLIDVDRDGDLDMLIGERAGNLNYYQNIGTTTVPSYSLVTTTLGGVDVLKQCCTGYSIPFMYDSAGNYRLIVGSQASRNYPAMGWVWYYKNIDGNLGGNFTLVDSMYMDIWEGERMAVNGNDINNDGGIDLVIGNLCGGVAMYLGDSTNVSVHESATLSFSFTVYPDPSSGELTVSIAQFRPNEKYELLIYNSTGERVASFRIKEQESRLSLHLPNGVYSCSVQTPLHRSVKKLIIIK